MQILQMEEVTVTDGADVLLQDYSMHVEAGSLYALIGDAESGKRTVLETSAGLRFPDTGSIMIGGVSMDSKEGLRQRSRMIGYLPQETWTNRKVTVLEYLCLYDHVFGVYGLSARAHCQVLLSQVELVRVKDSLMCDLSKSVVRLVDLVRTTIHSPLVLLLDEPFNGMDAHEKSVAEEFLRQCCSEEKGVVITGNSMQESLVLCDTVGLISEGRSVMEGTPQEILLRLRGSAPLMLEIHEDQDRAVAFFHRQKKVTQVSWHGNYFRILFEGGPEEEAALLREMVEAGIRVSSFTRGGEGKEPA